MLFPNIYGFINWYDDEERVKMSRFDDFDEEIKYADDVREFANQMQWKAIEKYVDGQFIYELFVTKICKDFDVNIDFNCPNFVYGIVNYYFDNEIMMRFDEWLNSVNGPLIRKTREIKKIFPEFKHLSPRDAIKLANEIYGCDIRLTECEGYIFSFSFDFNIKHIEVKALEEIKKEIEFCNKYGVSLHQESVEKLYSLGFEDGVNDELFNKIIKSL